MTLASSPTADLLHVLDELRLADRSVAYCDVRIEATYKTRIQGARGELTHVAVVPSLGAFLRVYHHGRWFTCASTDVAHLEAALADLVAQALASPVAPGPWSAAEAWQSDEPVAAAVTPMDVPLAEKRALCEAALAVVARHPKVAAHELTYADEHVVKCFASSHGTRLRHGYQLFGLRTLLRLADGEDRFLERAHACAPEFAGLAGACDELEAEIVKAEAFLGAPAVTPGHYRMVLSPRVVGTFTHESFGHKSEADFMLGDQAAMDAWRIGAEVAAPVVSIVDDGTWAGTSGYCPWDDEGMPARKNYLIKDGKLMGRLHSRATAQAFDEAPTGNGRALDFTFEPIVRMTSTFVEPGTTPFEDLVARVEDGLYLETMRGGTGMSTFTLAIARAYRIRGGKLAEPVRVNVVSGSVFEALRKIEAVSDAFELVSTTIGGCGKFDQVPLRVALGGPHVLIDGLHAS